MNKFKHIYANVCKIVYPAKLILCLNQIEHQNILRGQAHKHVHTTERESVCVFLPQLMLGLPCQAPASSRRLISGTCVNLEGLATF